jgi:transposase
MGSHPAKEQLQRLVCLQRLSVSLQKPGGALVQQAKQFRGIATRYDKNPDNFLAAIKRVSVRIWIHAYESAA